MSEGQKFRHVLVVEDRKGRRMFSLEDDVYTIGRDSNNTIVLYDYQVSRTHATVVRTIDEDETQNSSYRILDGNLEGKKSTNGIYVNGRLVVSHQLKHGDNISFGSDAKTSYYIISTESGIDLFNPEGLGTLSNSRITLGSDESEETVISKKNDHQNVEEQEELIRLASFPELSPNPIVEIDWDGNLTYVNPAASLKFPTIYEDKLEHPILANLLSEDSNRQGNLFLREVKIGTEVFEQYVHYLSEKNLVRNYIFDFTKRKIAEAQLRENQARYQTILSQISQGIFLAYANNRRIIEANSAFLKLLGYSPEEISSMTIYNVIDKDLTNISNDLTLVAEKKRSLVGEYLFRCQDGSLINLKASISITSYQGKEIFCFVIQNISPTHEKEFANYLVYHDEVTHLPNRKLFEELLSIWVAKAENHHYLLGLIVLEIENWQSFSNSQTSENKHKSLKNIVHILQSSLKSGDLLARWDSHKFMILLPHITGPQESAKIAKKISTTLNQYLEKQSEENEVELKAHISLLTYPIDGEDASLLVKNALFSLEQAIAGNNPNYGVTGFNLTHKSASLLKLENLIGNAVKEQQFLLCYQPKIDSSTQKLTGLEALLRWEHPELGQITPRHFLRLTEETEFMLPLGVWILQTATLQMQKWLKEDISPLPIGVNISKRQFTQPNFVTIINKILEQSGLPPHLLELELSENCFLQNPDVAYQTLEQLSALKIRLCLDSFGTENLALVHLQKAPFNSLKIGPSIISTIDQDPKAQALVQSMAILCQGYGISLVAVGVEKLEQMELLKNMGCTEIQGNLLSRPLIDQEASVFLHHSDRNIINFIT